MDDKPISVLLVEDNPGDVRLLREILAELASPQYRLTLAGRLDEALRRLEEARFDLVMLDLGLPDEQGFDTFARVHERAAQTPIIVLTGLEDETVALKTVRGGAQDYLVKAQFDGNLLSRAMRYAIERKQAEEALRRSQERWRTYIDGANDLIFTLDPAGRITSANRALCATSGYREEELLGRDALGLIAPESYAVTAEALAKVLSQEDVEQAVLEAITKDGRRLTLEVRGRMLYEEGQFAGTFHIARDITQRKQAEEALRASEELFRLLFEYAPIGMAITDLEGRYVRVNPAYCTMLGYTEEELLARSYIDATYPEDLPINVALREAAKQGESPSFELEKRLVTEAGEVVHALLRASLVRDAQGRPLYFISQMVDITERKQAEEQLQTSLGEKEVLLKEIHHRVKNNLQVVSSLLALQANSVTDPQGYQMFQDSLSRIRAMSLIHERLYRAKDLASIDAGEYVRDLVAHLFSIYANPARVVRSNVRVDDLTLDIDTAIPCGLLLTELVSNALKHAFPPGWAGEGRIDVELRAAEAGRLTLVVSDDGVGLSPDLDLRHAHSLGLQLVNLLAGQIRGAVELDRSAGTTFRVTFPSAARQPRWEAGWQTGEF